MPTDRLADEKDEVQYCPGTILDSHLIWVILGIPVNLAILVKLGILVNLLILDVPSVVEWTWTRRTNLRHTIHIVVSRVHFWVI